MAEDSGATPIAVLGNDTDPDTGTTLTITEVTQPTNGTVVITGGGTGVTYTPDANFAGTDTFTYTITDGALATDTATVTITVTPVNDAPTAQDFAGTVAEDSTNIAVDLTTLTDDVDGDALTYTITTPLANGTLTPTGTPGIYTYTPNANFTGTDSFTYTVSDGTLSDTGTVSVTVTPVNDAPTAQDFAGTVAEDSTNIPVDLTTLTDDVDGDALTYTITTPLANGTLTPTGTPGHYTYTPNANFTGPDSFTYTVSDGTLTDTGTVSVTVTPVNDAPVAVDDVKSTNEDIVLSFPATDLSANDTDVDGTTPTVTAVSNPTGGTVDAGRRPDHLHPHRELHRPRRVRLHPLRRHPDRHRPRHRHHHRGQRSPRSPSMTPPPWPRTPPPTPSTVLANDTDPDTGTTLTITAITQPTNGTVAITGGGTGLTYTPNANFAGTDTFTYTITDGAGATDNATVSVTVTNRQRSPQCGRRHRHRGRGLHQQRRSPCWPTTPTPTPATPAPSPRSPSPPTAPWSSPAAAPG